MCGILSRQLSPDTGESTGCGTCFQYLFSRGLDISTEAAVCRRPKECTSGTSKYAQSLKHCFLPLRTFSENGCDCLRENWGQTVRGHFRKSKRPQAAQLR